MALVVEISVFLSDFMVVVMSLGVIVSQFLLLLVEERLLEFLSLGYKVSSNIWTTPVRLVPIS